MSPDLSISYTDGTEDIWIPVSPQSVVTNEWLPIAKRHGWRWIELLCDNVCQVFEKEEAMELLAQLQAVEVALAKWEAVKPPLSIG